MYDMLSLKAIDELMRVLGRLNPHAKPISLEMEPVDFDRLGAIFKSSAAHPVKPTPTVMSDACSEKIAVYAYETGIEAAVEC